MTITSGPSSKKGTLSKKTLKNINKSGIKSVYIQKEQIDKYVKGSEKVIDSALLEE